jgi:hypothetical protein
MAGNPEAMSLPGQHAALDPAAVEIYREACASIRATDEISLKLLAAVPIVSGVGITLLIRTPSEGFPGVARFIVSLFAAAIAFAIYRWERKNIATCAHFRSWAELIEKEHFDLQLPKPNESDLRSLPHGAVSAPEFLRLSWGKTQAEICLYWIVILTWLAVGAYALIA